MSVSGRLCVVSPHLLVGQAIAAALESVGTSAEARAWDSVVADVPPGGPVRSPPPRVIALTEGADSPTVIEQVHRLVAASGVRVLVVTSADAAVKWGGLLENELIDVISATTSVAELAVAAQRLEAGQPVMTPERRFELAAAWAQSVDEKQHLVALIGTLSPQQRRVLELLASGRRVNEVGLALGVSSGTIRSHVKALRAKLGASSQLKAVALYHQAYGHGAEHTPATRVPRPRRSGDGSVRDVDGRVSTGRR